MSWIASLASAGQAAVTKGCDRLVHPSVSDAESRLRHRRLLGVLLAGPFLAASAIALTFPQQLGGVLTLVSIALTLASGWLAAMVVAATGRTAGASAGAFAAAILVVASIVAAAGGAGSPAALCAAALVLEPYWLHRSRRAMTLGIGGAAISLMLAPWLPGYVAGEAQGSPVWHWLVPMAYAGAIWMRLAGTSNQAGSARTIDTPIDGILDAAVIRIGGENDVTSVSDRSREILGLPSELLLGQGLFERIHVADRVAYLCELARQRDAGAQKSRVELRVRLPGDTAGGNFQPFALDVAADGETGEIVGVLRNNKEVADLRSKLEQALDRIERVDVTKDRFLASVSHELRTPLNAVIGFSDVLLQEMYGKFQDPRQKEYVGLIRDAGHHLLAVVNTILDVSKIESGAYVTYPERFEFREAVDMCRSMLGTQAAAKGLRLVEEVAPATGQIVADRRAVQQMLINLVSNAIKFTPEGGQVAIGAKKLGSRLHFWVADTGIGIAAADLERIGRPFVQVQNDYTRRYDGTGLGLALVKGMVVLHHGEMSIESAPGEGTTVFINLPVEGPQAMPADEFEPTPLKRKMGEADGALRKTA